MNKKLNLHYMQTDTIVMKTDQIKALVVDDDPRFLETMQKTLESKSCFVKCTSDKQEAMSILINEIFHVVFIDCVLQSGQGTDLMEKIRESLGYSVEIIMMSGVVPEKSLSRYVDIGICDFLSKPISDKEIDKNLNSIKEKILYGNKQNILRKIFTKYDSIQKLKFFISLKQARDYEFFLYLNGLLLTKESVSVTFKFNNKQHKVTLNKGFIVDYEGENAEDFLNKLLSKNFITYQEKEHFKPQNHEECVHNLLKNCILSSSQISDIKYDMLVETFKEIVPGIEISFTINLIPPKKDTFLILNKNEYTDLLFLFLKQKFNNHFFSLFDEDVMQQHLIFEENKDNSFPKEMEDFIHDIKEGMKLKGIYNKYINDKNTFCTYTLYILLKEMVYFPQVSFNIKYNFLYERYQNLYKIINKLNKPEQLFLYFSGLPTSSKINSEEIKAAYLYFIKYNHPDKFPFDIPKDLLDLMNKVLSKLKNLYDFSADPTFKTKQEAKKKKEELKKTVLLTENKKICERYLEKQQYEKAFSLIKTIPQEVMNKEAYWQLLYLWIHFEKNNINTDAEKVHKYMKYVQTLSREFVKEKLYHYVLGLYHENKKNYSQAKICFQKTQTLDPSFQSCYLAINRCSLILIKEEKAKKPSISKLIDALKNKKQKKVS